MRFLVKTPHAGYFPCIYRYLVLHLCSESPPICGFIILIDGVIFRAAMGEREVDRERSKSYIGSQTLQFHMNMSKKLTKKGH